MDILNALQPQRLWHHFEELCHRPRISGSEQAAAAYVLDCAAKAGLTSRTDSTGNVVVTKPASPGNEQAPAVILQGHLDMVGQKNGNVQHDFSCDPIVPVVDKEWVHARGTTLGADNGIGVAAILAVLEDPVLVHPPLQGLFTVEEETGLNGALGLTNGFLSGEILLNLDSSDESELCIGCAGGCDIIGNIHVSSRSVPQGFVYRSLAIRGLKGGHSGVDINRGRGNAVKLLARLVYELGRDNTVLLCSIRGGSVRNAIPREADAIIAFSESNLERMVDRVWIWQTKYERELSVSDHGIVVELAPCEPVESAFEPRDTRRVLRAISALVHGPIRMSSDTHGTVETSNNVALVESNDDSIRIECLVRSLLESRKQELADAVAAVFELTDANYELTGDYPGWAPNPTSPVISLIQQVYQDLHGISVTANVVHAGLECGIIGAANPGMQMVSMGPTIRALHSPEERVQIASVARFYDSLVEILKRLAVSKMYTIHK